MKKPVARSVPSHRETLPRKSGGGTIFGIVIGLVLGVSIAFGVVWYLNRTPLPFMNKFEGAPRDTRAPGANGGAAEPKPLAGKPGDKVAEKPRFDFYGILEGKQPAAADTTPGRPASTPAPVAPLAEKPPAPKAEATGEVYYLQAGAFQKAADAENLKAKMALLGVEASIQKTEVADKGTMHRVRVGPLSTPEEMNEMRTQMAQGGVQATVIKQKVN